VTPELKAVLDRIAEYFEARRVMNAIFRQEDPGKIHECRGVELRVDDLRALLAAADPAGEATRARQHKAAADIQDLTADLFPELRHQPLTDESCGVIPTKAGSRLVDEYRAHRTEQHPKAEALSCPHCGQDVHVEANGTIGVHTIRAGLVTGPHGNPITCPAIGSKP
jgi:hypothetical protein